MIRDITQDPDWSRAFAAIDHAFAGTPRPDHFTSHTHCCECAETDAFFQAHTPGTFGALTDPLETMPVAFLTQDAFAYLAPGILRYLARTGEHYNTGDVLFHLENRWQTFTPEQQSALRDLLYIAYERLKSEIEATPFDYHTLTRILTALDEVTHPKPTS
jgi:hypothetical protein